MNKSKSKFIGIFGGTFDPVHKGHTEIIKNLFELIPLDKVIVIPNGIPPHKPVSVNSEERLRMVTSAFKDVDKVVIDNREIRKKDTSYAISTLKELIEENVDHSLVWIMGSDAFSEIDSWYQWQDFIKMVNIIVMVRPNHEIPFDSEAYKLLSKSHTIDKESLNSGSEKIYLLRIRPIEISSTDIRNKINEGKDVSEFLLEEVNELITKRNLYQKIMTISLKNKIIESLEDIKAVNPVAINVKKISSLTDFMIIASGTSVRHIAAIGEKVIDGLKKNRIKDVKVEGQVGDDWVLVDAGDVIVHLMSAEAREFYDLESLWDPDL